MKLAPMPTGLPHEHLGASHVCKHYLNQYEVWEDLSDPVERELRPFALITRLHVPARAADEEDRVPDWGLPHMVLLGVINEQGYTAAVGELLRHREEPPYEGWFDSDRDFIGHAGAGVLAIVRLRRGRWELVTAYRVFRYRFNGLPIPMDRDARRKRTNLAVLLALRKLLGKVAS